MVSKKERGIYIGMGVIAGVVLGFLSFSKIKVTVVGNVDKVTISTCSSCGQEKES
ncbi:MAG: hypothetical protein LRY73_12600 [Bacillus sp. (in: Bacteria)]|nr:hypothetical protein [Bacillus sp. (in: firmicutes)]